MIFILLFFCISFASCLELNLNKEDIQPGETLIGEIKADFVEQISPANIQFFEGKREVFFEYDLILYNNTHYLYAYMTREGNFTLKIKDIIYRTPEIKQETIEKSLLVKKDYLDENQTQTQILSVSPGFVFTSQIPKITLSNKGTQPLEISYDSSTIPLASGEFKDILHPVNQTFSYLTISSYHDFKIPVIYLSSEEVNQTPELKTNLTVRPSILQVYINAENRTIEKIELFNFGETNLTNFSFELENLSFIELSEMNFLQAKTSRPLELYINSANQGSFKGRLIINFSEENKTEISSLELPIEVYVFEENATIEEVQPRVNSKTCVEEGGSLCVGTCEGRSLYAFDGYCCIGTCAAPTQPEEPGEGGGFGWIIGIIIFIILGIAGFFAYKKIKSTKAKKPAEKLEEVSKKYEKKVVGHALER